ncbi:MAG: ABC transporter permease [Chthonomonadales bacterium]
MWRYVGHRLLLAVPTLVAVSLITFLLGYFAPGSPLDIMAGQHADPEIRRRLAHEYGLDQPAWAQYVRFVWGALHGDLGRSFMNAGRPVTAIIAEQFPVTAELAYMALGVAILVGIPLGVAAALNQNGPLDRATMGGVLLLISLPAFVLAPVLILVFCLKWQLLPTMGWEGPASAVLPVAVLAARPTALLARFMRSSMLEVIRQDYIRTAYAKGLPPHVVVLRHGMRNAFLPILTVIGNSFGYLLSGSFVVETIFSVPGIGYASVDSILKRDYPVIQGVALLVATVFILVNLVVDLLYGLLDPRIRYGEAR